MVMCFAPTCKHYSQRDGCKFFVFPKDPVELNKWIKLIRRQDKKPGVHSRICSCHFLNQDRTNRPTIFDYNVGKQFSSLESKPKRKKSNPIPVVEVPTAFGKVTPEGNIPERNLSMEIPSMDKPSMDEPSMDEPPLDEPSTSRAHCLLKQPSAELEVENYFLRQEVDNLTKQLEELKVSFSTKHIESNDQLTKVFTGLPTYDTFKALVSLFDNINVNYYKGWQVVSIKKADQILLTLMKLKLNLLNDDLGVRFNTSRQTVANIFITWLLALHEILFEQFLAEIPSKRKNQFCMPTSFNSFTNCRIIIDCTEVKTVRPKKMDYQKMTYSSYKHGNTLKGLVGCAPNGVITFCSKLYPGSTSDKKITIDCEIMKQMVPGDLILADKGFLIGDILPQGVALNVPPFLTNPQFTTAEINQTRTIAKARIHIERAIRRMKVYTILENVPAPLIPHSSKIFQVVAALTNLHFPLIKEVELQYSF